MFGKNLKNLRKQNGLTQEELAVRLSVVRQTISKWEKGLSVPDADLLIRIAEIFEISVSTLLGEMVEALEDKNIIAQKLEQLNAQLAEQNRRRRLVWTVVVIVLIVMFVLSVFFIMINLVTFSTFVNESTVSEGIERVIAE